MTGCVVRERDRHCDGCGLRVHSLLLVALGAQSFRACSVCWYRLAGAVSKADADHQIDRLDFT